MIAIETKPGARPEEDAGIASAPAREKTRGVPLSTSRIPQGGIFLGLRYGLGILVSFGNMLVMTRWIGPHAYGLFVTALGLTSFLAALTRGGIDTYLIRAETAPDKHSYDVASTLIAGLSLVLVVGGAAITPLLIVWYRSREFVPAYLISLLTIPLAGLAGPPTAKLERDLNFRAVATIELGGQLLALFVSATLAWLRLGVWAPVMGLLVWQAWAAGAAMRVARLRPRPAVNRAQARAMLSFGLGYSASLRVWQLRTLVNPLLVGRFAGPEGVAFVGLAIRIGEGLGFIRAAAGRLAIATLSRARENSNELRSILQRGLALQIVALGPLLCAFGLVAPFVIPRVLGMRWMPAMQVYPFIAAGVLVNALYNLQASALFVVGRQWVVLRGYIAQMVLLAIGTLLLLPGLGLRGYGWAELAACAAYVILHRGLAGAIRVSYRTLAPLTLAFLAPPFALLARTRWTFLFWLPLLATAGWLVCRHLRSEQPGGGWKFNIVPLLHERRSHIA